MMTGIAFDMFTMVEEADCMFLSNKKKFHLFVKQFTYVVFIVYVIFSGRVGTGGTNHTCLHDQLSEPFFCQAYGQQ